MEDETVNSNNFSKILIELGETIANSYLIQVCGLQMYRSYAHLRRKTKWTRRQSASNIQFYVSLLSIKMAIHAQD